MYTKVTRIMAAMVAVFALALLAVAGTAQFESSAIGSSKFRVRGVERAAALNSAQQLQALTLRKRFLSAEQDNASRSMDRKVVAKSLQASGRVQAEARMAHRRAVAASRHRAMVMAVRKARAETRALLRRKQAAARADSQRSAAPGHGGSSSYGGSLGSWLLRLRSCESGGNYRINTGNGYYGAYQFAAGTWNSLPSQYSRYSRADLAPPSVQDAAIIYNTRRSSGGLATQNPGCYNSQHLSAFPPG